MRRKKIELSNNMNTGKLEVKSDNIDILMDISTFSLFDSCKLILFCDTYKVHNYLSQGFIDEYVFSNSDVEYYLPQLIESYINGCVEEYILKYGMRLKQANIDVKYSNAI